MGVHAEEIRAQLRESCAVKQRFSDELLSRIESFAERSAEALGKGGKIVFFGNGGSAADAQHLAAELVVRLGRDRPALAALALSANTSQYCARGRGWGRARRFLRSVNRRNRRQAGREGRSAGERPFV